MATKKDYYDILGISKSANEADIKNAYRKLAREHHPDMVQKEDKEAAEKRFKEINEAYQVLSNPEKRKMYDQFGHAGVGGAGGGAGQGGFGGFGGQQSGGWGPFTYTYSSGAGAQGGFDPFDIFEDFFGFRGFGGQRKPKKGKNLYYEMHISFEDAVKGVEKEINTEAGKTKIKIPSGARNGTELKFAGKGMPGPDNVPAGDLFISLRVPTPEPFQRVGDNLGIPVEIDFVQATLGDVIEVPVVDIKAPNCIGTAKLKIPQGTQPGTQFRIRGKGMPKLRGNGNGDVIAQVFVSIPTKLSRKQKKVLEEYREL